MAAMVMVGIGEVDQGILDLGIRGTFTDPVTGVTVFTVLDGGDMGRTGEAIILMEGIPLRAMDT